MPLVLLFGKKYYDYRKDEFSRINQQKELELKILRAQFDPHFLYNSLNTIDALVDYASKETIKKYISNLADVYRYLVQTKDEELILVEDELDLIKKYLFLIETRFEGDYNFDIIVHSSYQNKYIPNGALLTTVENIVKHNTPDEDVRITARISIEKENIKVSNNKYHSINHEESLGTGLKNLKKRYELLADETIEIRDNEKEFIIELPMLNIID